MLFTADVRRSSYSLKCFYSFNNWAVFLLVLQHLRGRVCHQWHPPHGQPCWRTPPHGQLCWSHVSRLPWCSCPSDHACEWHIRITCHRRTMLVLPPGCMFYKQQSHLCPPLQDSHRVQPMRGCGASPSDGAAWSSTKSIQCRAAVLLSSLWTSVMLCRCIHRC